jgi:2-polyprenyl-6-methoxyphenol hydroxylase-like FAD-dependent oxidoreductase
VEVLIVGGGIGGMATAISLREAGHEVRVLEKALKTPEV